MTESKRPLKVFLSYASQDRPFVRELSRRLVSEGWIDTWLDEKKLLPGEDWRLKIEEAVEDSDVVIICLSSNSVTKEGYVQKELRYAREMALEKPEGTIFLIPLRLDECEVPRGLRFYQWVDFFGEKKDESYDTLTESLKLRHDQKLRLEDADRAQKEKLEADRIAREETAREKAEKEATERAAREKTKKDAAEKARLEAEELTRQKNERKKAESKPAEKPKLVEEKPVKKTSRVEPRPIETQPEQRKPNTVIVLWGIGLIVIVFVISMIALDNEKNSPTINPTTTGVSQTENLLSETPNIHHTSEPVLASPTDSITVTSLPVASDINAMPNGNAGFSLIYILEQDGKRSLNMLNPEGTSKELVSKDEFSYLDAPALSPLIDFIAIGTDQGIYSVDLNKEVLKRLTISGIRPTWSPDNTILAFETGDPSNYSYNITRCSLGDCVFGTEFVSNQQIKYIHLGSNNALQGSVFIASRGAYSLSWNMDGSKIAYIKKQNVDFICEADSNSRWPESCIQVRDYANDFDWSPLTNKVVFSASWRGNSDIYLGNFDDLSQVNLTQGKYDNYSPVWNYSGDRIAFVSTRGGNSEIYLMNADGTGLYNVTQNTSNDFSPIWSFDNKNIIFVSDRSGNLNIFALNLESQEVTTLTNNSFDSFFPVLVPNSSN